MTQTSQSTRPDVISLADEERVNDVVLGAVLGLWDVVNNLTRLRPSRRDRYRVTIFGSARATPGSFGYEETRRAAAMLAAMGCDIVTGGGPGLMQAANEGASTAPERARSIGIRVELPFEQDVNAFVAQAFRHRTFFTRLHQFAIASDAFIVAPGGIGTVLEMVMIWQLLQVRHLQETPLILVGPTWPALIEWARQAMLAFDPPLADAEDLAIPRCVASADEALAIIQAHHATWLRAQPPGGPLLLLQRARSPPIERQCLGAPPPRGVRNRTQLCPRNAMVSRASAVPDVRTDALAPSMLAVRCGTPSTASRSPPLEPVGRFEPTTRLAPSPASCDDRDRLVGHASCSDVVRRDESGRISYGYGYSDRNQRATGQAGI